MCERESVSQLLSLCVFVYVKYLKSIPDSYLLDPSVSFSDAEAEGEETLEED